MLCGQTLSAWLAFSFFKQRRLTFETLPKKADRTPLGMSASPTRLLGQRSPILGKALEMQIFAWGLGMVFRPSPTARGCGRSCWPSSWGARGGPAAVLVPGGCLSPSWWLWLLVPADVPHRALLGAVRRPKCSCLPALLSPPAPRGVADGRDTKQ